MKEINGKLTSELSAPRPKRTYKDGVFRALFNDEDALLELCSALLGIPYPKGTPIRIVTLKDTLFGDLKNDLAFVIEERLIILAEHQSTLCPNLPLRMLYYLAKEYERETYTRAIYSRSLIPLPAPELYVFYNGMEDAPLEQELKLSDAFLEKRDTIVVEAVVKVINVNYEKGAELLRRCRSMREYSLLIHKIRERYKIDGNLKAAIAGSIQECREENILTEFLKKNGGEIMSFLFEELSREEREKSRQQQLATAARLKEMGLSPEKFAEATGLALDEARKL